MLVCLILKVDCYLFGSDYILRDGIWTSDSISFQRCREDSPNCQESTLTTMYLTHM